MKANEDDPLSLASHAKDVDSRSRMSSMNGLFSSDYSLPCLLLFCMIIQLAVSSGSYSGENKPPMYGDFEAQRHWMEITSNLPISEWYVNTSRNDLEYWGLDYPPLTAYHSYILGLISDKIDPSWVALESSRGIEDHWHKFFMRISVLSSYWTTYVPFLLILVKKLASYQNKVYYSAIALLYPGLISMDNGHFQYNHISLGLFVITVYCFYSRRLCIGSIAFSLAVNYKQMELYHSLPVAVYLLSISLEAADKFNILSSFYKLFKLFLCVFFTFGLLWFPFIHFGVAAQVIARIFPFYRGLFEDKVGNFWCTISVIVKLKEIFEISFLVKLSTFMVLLSILPSLLLLFRGPTMINFKYSLVTTSLAFYLFSFQVHEKSILLVAIPAIFLWQEHPVAVVWLLNVSNISLYPLCIRDNNSIHLAMFILFYVLSVPSLSRLSVHKRCLVHLEYIVLLVLCIADLFCPPPPRYPHLFPLLISVLSFLHFFMFFIYFNYSILKNSIDDKKKSL